MQLKLGVMGQPLNVTRSSNARFFKVDVVFRSVQTCVQNLTSEECTNLRAFDFLVIIQKYV